jgi:hypothetical protein
MNKKINDADLSKIIKGTNKKSEIPKELMDRLTNAPPAQIWGLIQGYLHSGYLSKDAQDLMSDSEFIQRYVHGFNIAKSEYRYKIKFAVAVERFEKLKILHRGQIPRLDYILPEQRYTRKISRSFIKNKMKYHYPYTMPTKEDVYQEAYIGYLFALKSFHPWKGIPDFHLKDAIEKHLFKVYEKANTQKRKSENKNYQLEYVPDYSEAYQETDSEIFKMIDSYQDNDENTISFKRGKSKESFDFYDEQEYKEPDDVEQSYKQDFGDYYLGYLLPGRTRDDKRNFSIDGFKIINLPSGIYEAVSENKRTFIGEAINKKGKVEQVKITIKEFMKNADRIQGSGIPYCEYIDTDKVTEHNIPAAKGGCIAYLEQSSDFQDLEQEAFDLIQSFPDEQRRFFELLYDDSNITISRNIITKKFSKTIEDDFVIMENPIAGEFIEALCDEEIIYQTKSLKDAARVLKIGNDRIKSLHDDGKDILRNHFLNKYGVNIVRDTTEKENKNKKYHFRTNFQVRGLLKN